MICYVKDYEDGLLKIRLQVWDDNKLTYETPVAKIDASYASAEFMAKLKCFVNLHEKFGTIEGAKDLIQLIPTYDMEN